MRFDVVEFTSAYEQWLSSRIPLVANDLALKHEQMAATALRFLRGTYYVWLARMADLLPELLSRTRVPAVCDLHVENFGTWHDAHGVLRWGVNDFDESARAGYAIDLVRLATSAALVPDLAPSIKQLCRLVLNHWRDADVGSSLEVDGEQAAHLRQVLKPPKPEREYYAALSRAPRARVADIPARVRADATASAGEHWRPQWYTRTAGTGSLGHPRFAAVGPTATDRWIAREAKLIGPPTAEWLETLVTPDIRALLPSPDSRLLARVTESISGPSPLIRWRGWQIRALSPEAVRVDLTGLRGQDPRRIVQSMAEAMANIHAADRECLAAARDADEPLGQDWLHEAVREMLADTEKCHREWRRHVTGTRL